MPKGVYKFATTCFLKISFNYCLSPVGKMFHQCYCEERESKGNQEWGGFLSRPNDSTRKSLRQGWFLFRNSLRQGYFLFVKGSLSFLAAPFVKVSPVVLSPNNHTDSPSIKECFCFSSFPLGTFIQGRGTLNVKAWLFEGEIDSEVHFFCRLLSLFLHSL